MAELKTKVTDQNVGAFLQTIDDEGKRQDSLVLLAMLQEITAAPPRLWGESIVGFGDYHYVYASGRKGDWFVAGFSPRKQNLTLYIMAGFEQYDDLLKRLGKHSTGSSCLYIKKLNDIDLDVLRELVAQSVAHMKATNPPVSQ